MSEDNIWMPVEQWRFHKAFMDYDETRWFNRVFYGVETEELTTVQILEKYGDQLTDPQTLLIKQHMNTDNTLTRGQVVMDINFNGGRQDIMNIKQACADTFDVIDIQVKKALDKNNEKKTGDYDDLTIQTVGNDISRLAAMAKTNIELASMLAVKAITRG